MTDREHTKVRIEEQHPEEARGVPDQEGVDSAEVEEGLERTPEGQRNRPDQPDATEDERRQFQDPPER